MVKQAQRGKFNPMIPWVDAQIDDLHQLPDMDLGELPKKALSSTIAYDIY